MPQFPSGKFVFDNTRGHDTDSQVVEQGFLNGLEAVTIPERAVRDMVFPEHGFKSGTRTAAFLP